MLKMDNIHSSWKPLFEKHKSIIDYNLSYYDNSQVQVYPPKEHIFKVFEMDVNSIKVVLLGQDPYHGKGQAHGLSFSVNKNVKIPPSLSNIYKELKTEFPDKNYEFKHGNLERWFNIEHIFLLNCSLSVVEGKAGSLLKKWSNFTDDVIKFISEHNKECIFLLLGNFSKDKTRYIDNYEKRCILGIHPSPLSAHRGFFGSNIFIELNKRLNYEVDWTL